MEISTEEKIKYLQKAIKNDEYQDISNISQSLLEIYPDDSQYQQCFAIASIRLGRFDILPKTIFKQMPKTGGQLDKLYAYYLYSIGDFPRSLDVLLKLKEDLSTKLLLSQVYFKMMEYRKSAQLMEDLMRTEKLDEEDKESYMVNLLASGYHTDKEDNIFKKMNFSLHKESCKELYYNYCLLLYEMNDIEGTKKYLSLFEQMLTKDDELDWITVKLLREYLNIQTKQNNTMMVDEYQSISNKTSDKNIKGVITNNLFFLKGHEEGLTDAAKQIDQMFDPSYKISKIQYIILKINKMSLLLRKNRFTQALRIMKEIQEVGNAKFLIYNNNYVINKYYAFKKTKDNSNIKAVINQVLESNQIGLAFCLLADHVSEDEDLQQMFRTLNETYKWENSIIKNYIFSQLIRSPILFEQNSNKLDEMITKTTDPKILQILLKVYESKNNENKQELILKKLLQINPKNMTAKTKMAKIALSNNNIEMVEELLRGVECPEEITDLTYLQYIEKNIHISVKKEEEPSHENENKKEAHKKRIKKNKKPKLPKNTQKFIQGYKGDPERWLPKWQRKGYKKKGKKGGKTQGLATVGKQQKNVYIVGSSTSAKEVTKDQKKRR